MARFHGAIGYVQFKETAPGVQKAVVSERNYYGDIIRDSRRWERGEHLNDDLTISNQFSIVADAFAYENLPAMRYVKWMGTSWKVTNVEVQRPRLILTIGGVYNMPTPYVEPEVP